MIIQHEETGRTTQIADGDPIPKRWYEVKRPYQHVPSGKNKSLREILGYPKFWCDVD